jgi:hypothetical protein
MANVSLFPNIKARDNGAQVKMHDIMAHIQFGKWKDKVEALREKKAAGAGKEETEHIKQSLPYFTPSGIFSIRRTDGLVTHSGKISIDFDHMDAFGMDEVRKCLQQDKYSEYVFVSCSGTGFCVIVNIDPDRHLESFLWLEKYYKNSYGLEIDKSCKDITRARFISYDPEMFYNPEYATVDPTPQYDGVTIDSDEEKFEWALNAHNKKLSFSEGNRHHYMVVLAYFLNKCGVSKEFTMDKFLSSYVGNGKKPDEITRIVNDCYKNELEFGQLVINKKTSELPPEFSDATRAVFAYAHDINNEGRDYDQKDIAFNCSKHFLSEAIVEGIFKTVYKNNKDAFGIDKKPEIFRLEYYISKKYDITKNEVTTQREFKKRGAKTEWELLNVHSLYRDIQHIGAFKFSLEKLKSLLQSDFVPVRNPIREYFDSLPEWNEKEEPDYITELASFIKTDNDAFWHVQFKKALVRAIACGLDYVENRIIIVLVQPDQNTGKTSFIRFLAPPALKPYYTETAMDSHKDSDIQLSQNFIWNLEELAALHNNEINKLKATISKSTVKQRGAYKEHAEVHPRRCTFFATTNKDQFLTDDQNTRWLCFNVIGIDHDYNNKVTGVRKININNVWAQAYTLYKRGMTDKIELTPEGPVTIPGFNYQLTKEEAEVRDAKNKDYELASMEKDLIMTKFRNLGKGKGVFMTYTEILLHLQDETDNKIKLNIHAVSKAMRQLGYESATKKVEGSSVRGYWCSPITAINAPVKLNADGLEQENTMMQVKADDIQPPTDTETEDLPF